SDSQYQGIPSLLLLPSPPRIGHSGRAPEVGSGSAQRVCRVYCCIPGSIVCFAAAAAAAVAVCCCQPGDLRGFRCSGDCSGPISIEDASGNLTAPTNQQPSERSRCTNR